MHLVSEISQLVKVGGVTFSFRRGETIHTECSYKYSAEEFIELANQASFELKQRWTDGQQLFSVYYFEKNRATDSRSSPQN